MLINYDDEINKIIQVRKGKRIEGLTLDIPEIDEYLRFKPSNFNLILGHANTGKTTVTLFLMLLYSVKHKIKWLVFSSENEPHTIIKKLIEFLSVQPINKIPTDQFDNNAAFIFDHFKFIDLKDRQLLDGLNGHEYDYEATSEIRQFCKKNQTSIWLTTHAATFATRIKHPIQHDYAGHPIPPLASDVEGGGKFVNRADDFMVIHRYIQHPTEWMINHIHIRKVKDTDTGGRPTPIDKPIMMKSIKNNVGFEINGKKTLNLALVEQINAPF